jgi:hypothetical protein
MKFNYLSCSFAWMSLFNKWVRKGWRYQKGNKDFVNWRTDNTMAKIKGTKGHTEIYKTHTNLRQIKVRIIWRLNPPSLVVCCQCVFSLCWPNFSAISRFTTSYQKRKFKKWLGLGEWLLFNANSAIVQLYHGENNLIFNEMMMRSTLY